LKAAGAIVLGKTNVPEMAIPYETDNLVFGRTNNPHNPQLTPAARAAVKQAAIAACLSPAGIGSDLSGSIRVPAHFCGIGGLKPTVGSVPMDGHTPPASGVVGLGACIGPLARHVKDLALLFHVLANPANIEMTADERLDAKKSKVHASPGTRKMASFPWPMRSKRRFNPRQAHSRTLDLKHSKGCRRAFRRRRNFGSISFRVRRTTKSLRCIVDTKMKPGRLSRVYFVMRATSHQSSKIASTTRKNWRVL
jgi:Asp-tRNA(Asn)/Glu-tRNA(Gln) amidotransferase A subunit family amidase